MKTKLALKLAAFLALAIVLYQPSTLFAQTTAFTYQGVLTENSAAANGVYDFEFALKDAATLGNNVGLPLTANDVGVTNGQFTVTLDYGSGVFNGSLRWLAIGVRPGASAGAYTNLSPRQAISSAPYAVYSAGAAAAGLTGNLPSAALAGTYSGALNLNNGANSFSGSGAGLSALSASQLATGVVPDARLSANVSLLGSTVDSAEITDGTIVNADINATAGITDTKLATISTAGKVANTATTANTANSPNTIVLRDGVGGFSAGTITASNLVGGGSGLTALNASQFASGTLLDARLSTNVALLNANQVFTASNRFAGVLVATNPLNQISGSFVGNASGLTNLNASQLTGTISANNIGAGSITTVMLAAGAVGSNQLAAGAVTTSALADGAVTAAKIGVVSNWFALTITNPTPAGSDYFGTFVAAVGSDRVLIGASGAGAAYLFSMDRTLLATFNNPTPPESDNFGSSVAVVGSGRVLIGAAGSATDAGVAYLFSTNGVLLTTFTNPTPGTPPDNFGSSVAAVGSDWVLIGSPLDNTGVLDAGAAYLFSTNGTLLTTFTNPTPAASDYFGVSVAAVGSDRVLIGAYSDNTGAGDAGAAYLFSTNGTLLTTFTNPTPAGTDYFGISVAAVGNNRVLIGAYSASTGATDTGAAYLFSTNGILLTTFTNPTPAAGDYFGYSVAAVGNDRLLIGARSDDTGATDAGVAYLFSTNGILLTTFTNSTPATDDRFGISVAGGGIK
jgi:hypothetical protein